jgi:hypothetical protein
MVEVPPETSSGSTDVARSAPADRISMLTNVLGLWPHTSVAAFALAAVFNIGYYSEIGLHFIGTADLTNLVYSAGLVFGFLLPVILGAFYFADWLIKYSRNPHPHIKIAKTLGAVTLVIGASPFIIVVVPTGILQMVQNLAQTFSPWWSATLAQTFSPWWAAAFLSIASISFFIADYIRFQLRKIYSPRNGLLMVVTLSAIFSIGKVVAHNQISSAQCYQIVTKEGTISDKEGTISDKEGTISEVRLVRTSTMGFIIAVNGRITFLSAGEVRRINAENAKECGKGKFDR